MIKSLINSFAICPDTQKKYLKIKYGKEQFIYDENNKKYLDASAGSCAVSNLGHGREDIGQVMIEQINKITVLPTHAFSSEIVESYLDTLVEFCSYNFSKAWTAMSGTEAVENAVKLAIQYHNISGNRSKHKVISRQFSYHGNSVFMLDIGGIKSRREVFKPLFNEFPHISRAYSYRRPSNMTEEEYTNSLVLEFENCIIKEDPDTIAAFVVEPVVGAALGAVMPPKGYFKKIKLICEKYNIIFISDEILSGFGRTGKKFGFEHFDIVPDIIALGKGLSGGYFPLSAIVASKTIVKPFFDTNTPFFGGHTFACNPVGASVGKEVISIIEKENLIENSRIMGEILVSRLKLLAQKYAIIGDVRGIGLQCGIELVEDRITKQPFPAELNLSKMICEKTMEKGVILYPGKGCFDGVCGDTILITPPLTINETHIDLIIKSLDESLEEINTYIDMQLLI